MLPFIIHNGVLYSNDAFKPELKNRLFLYGDGLFETMLVCSGKVLFLKDHFRRFSHGMHVLGLENNLLNDYSSFRKLIAHFINKNNISKNARLRLSIFRYGEDRYLPQTDEAGFLLWGENHEDEIYTLKKIDAIGIYDELLKSRNKLSELKTANSLLYVMAARHAAKNKLDEVLILNDKKQAIEGYRSNLFWVNNKVLYTSSLKSGAMQGIMRKQVLRIAKKSGIKIIQQKIKAEELLQSDEVFFTNTIQGIMFFKITSTDSIATRINEELKRKIGN